MKKITNKFMAASLAFTLGLGGIVTVTNAKSITESLKATYNNIKVAYNGSLVSPKEEPFMVNGRVYVSLRDAGEITGNAVDWKNNTVYISNGINTNLATLQQEVAEKNYRITTLTSKISQLEKELELLKGQGSNSSNNSDKTINEILDSALKVITKDYDEDFDVEWTFDLTSRSNYIELDIKFDGDDYSKEFSKISATKLKGFIDDICGTLASEFKGSDLEGSQIKGELYDTDAKKAIGTFTYSKSGSLSYDPVRSSTSYSDMEEDLLEGLLDDTYEMRLPYLRTRGESSIVHELPIEDISISERNNKLYFEIEIDFKKPGSSATYAEEWNDVDENRCLDTYYAFMKSIAKELADEYSFSLGDIEGTIIDSYTDDILGEYSSDKFRFKDAE